VPFQAKTLAMLQKNRLTRNHLGGACCPAVETKYAANPSMDSAAQAMIKKSAGHFQLVAIYGNNLFAAHDFQQHGHALTGNRFNQTLKAHKGRVGKTHRGTRAQIAQFRHIDSVAPLLQSLNGTQSIGPDYGRRMTKTDNMPDATRGSDRSNRLIRVRWPEKNVAREHGLKRRMDAGFGLFQALVKGKIGIESLMLQVLQGHGFKSGAAICQKPHGLWKS
jgi:hypothetical protein